MRSSAFVKDIQLPLGSLSLLPQPLVVHELTPPLLSGAGAKVLKHL